MRLEELAERLDARLEGEGGVEIRRVAPIEEAGEGDLAFLAHPRYAGWLEETGASAVLVHADHDGAPRTGCTLLRVEDPYFSLARCLEILHPAEPVEPGVREGAFVHPEARVGARLAAFPGCCVEAGAELGDRVCLHAGAVIGAGCRVGNDVVLHPNVVLYPGTELGDRVVVHAGTVLGSDGFGWTRRPGGWVKVPQVGRLVVEDDVEIGANVAVDRGSIGETRIGRGTKIDNLVQIAHNVRVGNDCLLIGQAGVAGSTQLGDDVVVAGQSGVAGHLRIGDGVRVAAKTAVFQDVDDSETVAGIPAIDIGLWRRTASVAARLPEILRRLRRLERRLEAEGDSRERGEDDPR